MGKHSGSGTGNSNQQEGRHVDRDRQPTGREPSRVDSAPDDHFTGTDNEYERGGRYDT